MSPKFFTKTIDVKEIKILKNFEEVINLEFGEIFIYSIDYDGLEKGIDVQPGLLEGLTKYIENARFRNVKNDNVSRVENPSGKIGINGLFGFGCGWAVIGLVGASL